MSAPEPKRETRGGGYFVSNYPPYAHWSADHVPAALEALDQPPKPGTPLGMYVHVPFCRKRCRFCYFKVYTDVNSAGIRAYVDGLGAELALHAKRAAIGGRKLQFVYVGGGTPSYLSVSQLEQLGKTLKVIPWADDAEVTFECEPGTLREPKVAAIRELGVTRVSLGVENFDQGLLELNGRAHGAAQIDKAYRMLRDVDFPQINLDLIAGMEGETDANWRFNIERTLELRPESVTIYQMEVPFNTTLWREARAEGRDTVPVASWDQKRRWVDEAFEALGAAGYIQSSGYTAVRADAGATFTYRDSLWHGADLLPVGVSSFGTVNGVHLQNEKHREVWLDRVQAGETPIQRAFPLAAEHRLIREFILQLKLGRLDTRPLRAKFGIDPTERFAGALELLAQQGMATVSGPEVRLTRAGLLQVDHLLPGFFLAEHGGPA